MQIRRAAPNDLERIGALLVAEGLSPLPSSLPLANVIVALERDAVLGAVAVEVVARYGVLRALVVATDRRRQGIGASLLRSLSSRCNELGLRDVYALAEKQEAQEFLAAQGFARVERAALPGEVRTWLRRGQAPESAPLLELALETRW